MTGTSRAAMLRKIVDRIDEREVVELARRLVRVPGQNPPGQEAATVELLARECRERGLQVQLAEVAPGRSNLFARLDGHHVGSEPGLLVLGHTDVVPPGEGWQHDPYGGTISEGRLVGRGSADMKGGLAAAVVAMAELRRAAVPLPGSVTLAALVDEEELGLGIRRYVDTLDPDTFRACLVAEPTSMRPIVAARGDAYVDVRVTGIAAHAGNPDDGRSAIHGIARVVTELETWHRELAAEPHPLAGPATWSVGTIEGGQSTSAVPAHARISADRRLLPGESAEAVLASTRERLERLGLRERGLGLEVTMTMDMPGFETAIGAPFVERCRTALELAAHPNDGLPLSEPGGWTAACDGGFVAQRAGVPVVVLGPGSVSEAAHRPDESVAIAELVAAARTYAAVIGSDMPEG